LELKQEFSPLLGEIRVGFVIDAKTGTNRGTFYNFIGYKDYRLAINLTE